MRDYIHRKGATFSPCRRWRYSLRRIWDDESRQLIVVGLNPSTANECTDDPTIRRCIGYARQWNLGGLIMLNLFAFRATSPKDMLAADDPIGPDNQDAFTEAVCIRSADKVPFVLCAWGAHGAYMDQDETALGWLHTMLDIAPHCLGLTKDGLPRHPLYMPKDAKPMPYDGRPK